MLDKIWEKKDQYSFKIRFVEFILFYLGYFYAFIGFELKKNILRSYVKLEIALLNKWNKITSQYKNICISACSARASKA